MVCEPLPDTAISEDILTAARLESQRRWMTSTSSFIMEQLTDAEFSHVH